MIAAVVISKEEKDQKKGHRVATITF